jgi:5'-deoxynucleotidase YfbR-like HD superfamily hydrolase
MERISRSHRRVAPELYYDLPEALTRDIISRSKKSIEGL